MTELESLFDSLWHDYAYRLCPSALKVHEILARDGRPIVNDHIALRTFASPQVGLDKLAKHFIALGYRQGKEIGRGESREKEETKREKRKQARKGQERNEKKKKQ